MQPNYDRLQTVLSAIVRGQDLAPLLQRADPAAFTATAARYRCAAVISHALAGCGPELAPLHRALRVHEIASTLRCGRLRTQLHAVVEVLNAAGIEPLHAIVLAAGEFGDDHLDQLLGRGLVDADVGGARGIHRE